MKDLIYAEECDKIIGASFEAYKDKGSGFLEAVFQECPELEPGMQEIPHAAQCPLAPTYKGHPLKQRYVADFVCFGKIVVELKAVEESSDEHRAQGLNYLNAAGHRLGLLINSGHYPELEWERLAL